MGRNEPQMSMSERAICLRQPAMVQRVVCRASKTHTVFPKTIIPTEGGNGSREEFDESMNFARYPLRARGMRVRMDVADVTEMSEGFEPIPREPRRVRMRLKTSRTAE